MRFFAQISAGKCVGIQQASTAPQPVAGDLFVEIAAFDRSYLGRAYTAGAWA